MHNPADAMVSEIIKRLNNSSIMPRHPAVEFHTDATRPPVDLAPLRLPDGEVLSEKDARKAWKPGIFSGKGILIVVGQPNISALKALPGIEWAPVIDGREVSCGRGATAGL